MTKNNQRHGLRLLTAGLMAVTIYLAPLAALAQTRIVAPKNSYKPSDDVQLGRQAAAEAERQLPILRDAAATDYVQDVGRRLVDAIPPEFQHPEFRYSFQVVDARDINAFALPGGPMFVNRGMIEAARNEGEMAGVMAHELSHVALRHGTAQASKAGSVKAQAPAIGGAILGAILGGTIGQVAAQAGQIGSAAYITKYSREYETQADVLGAQIMARAGYDPRNLANMFRTIEQQSGGRGNGVEWLSTHPNPGNRYARINEEAAMLRVSNPIQNTARFNNIQSRLRGMPRARTMEEIAQNGQRSPQGGEDGRVQQGRVDYPSSRYRTYNGGNVFRVSVPDNWRELGGQQGGDITFAPEGAYGTVQNQFVFTHGVQIGIARSGGNNLRDATDQFINNLLQGNSYLRQQRGYQRGNVSGREALATTLAGQSNVTGRTEIVNVYTRFLDSGDLFYVISVAPRDDYNNYQTAFNNVVRSIQIADGRTRY